MRLLDYRPDRHDLSPLGILSLKFKSDELTKLFNLLILDFVIHKIKFDNLFKIRKFLFMYLSANS